MRIKNEAWILADNRPGTASQSIGLANEIGLEYKIITLDYSFFSFLPNFFLSKSLLHLSRTTKEKFKNLDYLPKLVISAGRRAAPVALYLKNLSQKQTKIVQIMHPNLDFSKFDLVILPKHDNIAEVRFPNLITTIGALTKINEKNLVEEKEKFASEFANIEKTKIALLLGGSSNKTKFSIKSAKKLAEIVSKISLNMQAKLLVLTSRRSGEELAQAVESSLNCDFQFFDWPEVKDKNPYLAILSYADFFIITGDSVSMISECCSTGKPVYIFDKEKISSSKHRKFHQNLFAENYAKKLLGDLIKLENFAPKKLQETQRVATKIKEILVD